MTNERLLRSKMTLYGDTYDTLSEYLGIVTLTLRHKVKGESQFNQVEMALIKERYQLTSDEFFAIFTNEVLASASE